MATPSRRRRLSGDFQPDHESFGRFIMSDQAADPALQVSRLIAAKATATAPRGEDRSVGEDPRGKRFFEAFEVHDIIVTEVGNPKGPRRAGEVTNDAFSAVYAEFGAPRRGQKGHRTLRKAAEPYHDPRVTK